MKKKVTKQSKVALCRVCHGMGSVMVDDHLRVCPQCNGSGRVWVSAEIEYDIKPYDNNQK